MVFDDFCCLALVFVLVVYGGFEVGVLVFVGVRFGWVLVFDC